MNTNQGKKPFIPIRDGGYHSAIAKSKAVEMEYQLQFEQKLNDANSTLKAEKRRCIIKQIGNKLYLRATLPLKIGDINKGKTTKQYDIALGISATLDGLKTAIEKAYKLSSDIDREKFDWTDWVAKVEIDNGSQTVGYLLERFEEEYFKNHVRTEKRVRFVQKFRIDRIKRYCPLDMIATEDNFKACINKVPTEGAKDGVLVAIKSLTSTFRLNYNFSSIKIDRTRGERKIPDDLEIEAGFYLFQSKAENRQKVPREDYRDTWKLKQWVYGMLAVFGLRPHELLVKPDIEWWLDEQNVDNTWKVNKDCKTGFREAFPLNADWIEKFDLKNPERLAELRRFTNLRTTSKSIDFAVQSFAVEFKRVGLTFKPYDLRHCWAIRAHILGIPIKAAADNLGHSVDVHTKTYQHWFGRDNRKRVISDALDKRSEVEKLKDEIVSLKLENERLKIELARATGERLLNI